MEVVVKRRKKNCQRHCKPVSKQLIGRDGSGSQGFPMALSGTVTSPFSRPAVLRLRPSVSCSFTPGQEVFGSSVVSCPECYRESSSDGQPTSLLSAVSPYRARRKEQEVRTGGSCNEMSKESMQTHHIFKVSMEIFCPLLRVNTCSSRWEQRQHWQSPIKWLTEGVSTRRGHSSSYINCNILLLPGRLARGKW